MANLDSVESRVRGLVADALQVPVEQVPSDLSLGGLPQWDSMGHMGVMLLLEERYGIMIDAELIAGLTSIPAICAYLKRTGKD